MREVLVTADTEQAYNAVVDRCQPTTARRQMGLDPFENYGWCSTALGFVAARASSGVIGQQKDSAHYCDPSSSEASQGQGSQLSSCCVEHDKCLTCDPGSRGCTGSLSRISKNPNLNPDPNPDPNQVLRNPANSAILNFRRAHGK